ncbi:MAG: PaaI family thioesterase [Candidatus Binatia bacterium]
MQETPYGRGLGLVVEVLDANGARLRLPYRDENSNPGSALHGGVAASLIDIGGGLVSLAGAPEGAAAHGAIDVSVSYLAAAIGEDIVAEARALRRGKEITYVEVDVATTGGKAIAKGIVVHRVVPAASEARTFGEPPSAEAMPPKAVSDMGRAFMKVPFITRLGMRNEGFEDGAARVRLPFAEANTLDGKRVHEGAILALMDTTGALSSWSITGLDFRFKASTVALHGQFVAAAEGEELVSLSQTVRRDEEIFWNAVSVVGAESKRLVARGEVVYRIVVPR